MAEELKDDTPVRDYAQQYRELVDALCSQSWLPRDDHASVLKLAASFRNKQARLYATDALPEPEERT